MTSPVHTFGPIVTPHCEYRSIVDDSGNPGYVNRILVGTPATGLVRIEWLQARVGQNIPVNWSWVQMYEFVNGFYPMRYQVADAQNLIVQQAVLGDFMWCLLWEHDTIPPPDALIRLNQYMIHETHPVVSGLYYTRSRPSEPLVFRGRGTGAFYDWQLGDVVECDGVPTGFLLIHGGLLKAMYEDSEEYKIGQRTARRVFNTPRDLWNDPESGWYNTTSGTSDLDWCTRVMQGGYFEKSGWPEFEGREFPFIVDTQIFCRHINPDGSQFP